jgi:hypothetical protein
VAVVATDMSSAAGSVGNAPVSWYRSSLSYIIKHSHYVIGLVTTCLALVLAVIVAEYFAVSGQNNNGLDYDALAFLVHTEVQGTLKKEIKELQQRIRLLEEDALFKGRKEDFHKRSGQPVSYPPVLMLPEGERKRILVRHYPYVYTFLI